MNTLLVVGSVIALNFYDVNTENRSNTNVYTIDMIPNAPNPTVPMRCCCRSKTNTNERNNNINDKRPDLTITGSCCTDQQYCNCSDECECKR